jgi:N-acetylglucosaminyldiphosphoundecaprenol N-acetyl-beta-D-mannosaminyltransferase
MALPERVTGVDLMQRLLEAAAGEGFGVFFLGARQDVLGAVVRRCREEYRGLRVSGWRDGYFSPAEHDSVIDDIRASGAEILLVGMPSPFKEVWCHRHRDRFGVRLVIGVGGSFDVFAGAIPRAPLWMQRAGLEWSWRLLNEPRKLWKRYLVCNSAFAWMMLREWLALRVAGVLRPRTGT